MINQIESVDTGIRAAMQANSIKPDEARGLRTQVAQLDRAAQRAAQDGTMPATQYHKMLAQIDHVSQRLRAATGGAFLIGSGGDAGTIRTATAQTIRKAEIVQYNSTRFSDAQRTLEQFELRMVLFRPSAWDHAAVDQT